MKPMQKNDSLEILELPETATMTEIKSRIAEKLSLFETLIEETKSEFLRRVYSKKMSVILEIEKETQNWGPPVSGSTGLEKISMSDELETLPDNEEMFLTRPVILSSERKKLEPVPIVPGPVAWLVRHTESKSAQTYPLFPGKNYIGRKLKPGLALFTVIDDDPYISRIQAVIYVEGSGSYNYFIADSAQDNEAKPSSNGTYLNGNKKRVSGKAPLKENDNIQVGLTKLVLKFNVPDIKKMVTEVEQSKYMNTVAIEG